MTHRALDRGATTAGTSEQDAVAALVERNVRATPANIVIARRQMMLSALLALREAEQ